SVGSEASKGVQDSEYLAAHSVPPCACVQWREVVGRRAYPAAGRPASVSRRTGRTLGPPASRVEAVFDVREEDFEVEGLFQSRMRAQQTGHLKGNVARLRLAATGDGDDLRRSGALAKDGQELEAVDPGHEDVDDCDVDLGILEKLERNTPVSGFDHVVAALFEEFMEDVAELALVIHDQQARFRHPESSGPSFSPQSCPCLLAR